MEQTLKVTWHDAGREPKCQPNPAYPAGINLDCSGGSVAACSTLLPYPARRCGYFEVVCETCGQTIAITTAGRPDDPRSLKVGCRLSGGKMAN